MNNFYRLVKLTLVIIIGLWSITSLANQEVSIAVYAEHDKYIKASAPYGVSWKLIELAAQSQKIKLVPQRGSWEAGLNRLKAEKVDLIFPSFQTLERKKWALFTLPLMATGSAIFTLPNNPVNNLSEVDFEHASVGVSADSIQEDYAIAAGFKNIYATAERSQLYIMLHEERLDYLFFASAAENYYCMYHSDSNNSNCLKQVGEQYINKPAHALSLNKPKYKAIMDSLNAGFIAIKDSQEVIKAFEHYKYTHKDLLDWQAALGSN